MDDLVPEQGFRDDLSAASADGSQVLLIVEVDVLNDTSDSLGRQCVHVADIV